VLFAWFQTLSEDATGGDSIGCDGLAAYSSVLLESTATLFPSNCCIPNGRKNAGEAFCAQYAKRLYSQPQKNKIHGGLYMHWTLLGMIMVGSAVWAADPPGFDAAVAFGALPSVSDLRLSPDSDARAELLRKSDDFMRAAWSASP
jgi:hypothetical protein